MAIESKSEALTLALALAVTAATEEQAQECIALAEQIANSGMTLVQVAACKRDAEKMIGAMAC